MHVRPLTVKPGEGVQQEVDSLVWFEGAGVDDTRRVRCRGQMLRSLLGHLLPAVPQAHALEDRILDQEQAIPANAVGERAPLQVGTDRDHRVAALECRSLEYLEDSNKPLGVRELEILELLGQARMHIVSKLEPEQGLEVVAPEYRLFVGVHEVVTVSEKKTNCPQYQPEIEEKLRV